MEEADLSSRAAPSPSPVPRGLLLAGGSGSRLHPLTMAVNKHLLPVYNKPLIYYPLTTLMMAGVREVAIVSSPRDLPAFRTLLGGGSQWGLKLVYLEQSSPRGIADALRLAAPWLEGHSCVLALGDNLLYGNGLMERLRHAQQTNVGATLFGFPARHPERYGVVICDRSGTPLRLEEKPLRAGLRPPQGGTALAVPGLYFYDDRAAMLAQTLRPSARGELEITDLNRLYLEAGTLKLERLGRGFTWIDAGLPGTLLQASTLVQTIERRTGLLVGCPEELAWRAGWIEDADLRAQAQQLRSSLYGRYLSSLLHDTAYSDATQAPARASGSNQSLLTSDVSDGSLAAPPPVSSSALDISTEPAGGPAPEAPRPAQR